jgi:hypothetical protein
MEDEALGGLALLDGVGASAAVEEDGDGDEVC